MKNDHSIEYFDNLTWDFEVSIFAVKLLLIQIQFLSNIANGFKIRKIQHSEETNEKNVQFPLSPAMSNSDRGEFTAY